MSGIDLNTESVEEVRAKLDDLKVRYGFSEPDRGDLEDPDIVWRDSKPDYTKANYQFLKGKTQNHAEGSLEHVVENLVKKWEMQASHFKDFSQWSEIDHDNYTVSVNGGDVVDGSVAYEIGNYNALMADCPAYKKYGELSFEESHELFRGFFTDGFPWEVLRVLSGPPTVLFTWRHWGVAAGRFQDNLGHGEMLEMFGLGRVIVNEDLKIQNLEVYFDPETFIKACEGRLKPSELKGGKALLGDIECPFAGKSLKIRI